jgi:plastocyanin
MQHGSFRRRLGYGIGLGVLSIAAIVGLRGQNATASAPPMLVKMIDMPAVFQPAKLVIKVGETVEWKNFGNSVHHASSDPSAAVNPADVSNPAGAKPFDSGFLQPGDSFSYTFTVPGTYKYICAPHETSGMSGEVVVQ